MNNYDDLQQLWQQGHNWQARLTPSQLILELKAELANSYRSIKNRNRNELLAAAVVIPIFLTVGFFLENRIAQYGAWFICIYALWVSGVMFWIKAQRPKQDLTIPFLDQLQKEISYFKKEKLLLGRVAWWYILPCYLGLGIFHWGLSDSWIGFLVMMSATLLLMIYILKINRDAVNNHITPLINKLQQLQKDLEN